MSQGYKVLRIVVDDGMREDEFAALYQEGEDAVIMIRRDIPDDQRVCILNKLLSQVRVKASPIVQIVKGSAVASIVFAPHLLEKITSATGQFV